MSDRGASDRPAHSRRGLPSRRRWPPRGRPAAASRSSSAARSSPITRRPGRLRPRSTSSPQKPGLAWVKQLRDDPALAGKVDWKAVDASFKDWDYKSQGLAEAGAALLTLVTVAITVGSLAGTLTSSLGLSGGIIANSAIQAGLQTIVNKAAVALVNNQGNLGKALKELGSTATLKSLAANPDHSATGFSYLAPIVRSGLNFRTSTCLKLSAALADSMSAAKRDDINLVPLSRG